MKKSMIVKRVTTLAVMLMALDACVKSGATFNTAVAPQAPKVQTAVGSISGGVSTSMGAEVQVVTAKPKKKPVDLPIVLASLPQIFSNSETTPKRTPLSAGTPKLGAAAICDASLSRGIPVRDSAALSGSQVIERSMTLSGSTRDRFVSDQLLAGNIPDFMRELTPVVFSGQTNNGRNIAVAICVTPDYLAVGNDRDFVRIPMGLPAAAEVATGFGFVLPTTKIVDAIYAQAGLQLDPAPMQAGSQMTSTDYLQQHNQTVENQRIASNPKSNILIAGQKKDLVLSNVLRTSPGKVAIYGWHRKEGAPIQPLSTVHGESYADYSHGIRLVSTTVFVNGEPRSLTEVLEDPELAWIISKEGPIAQPVRLIASISTN